MSIVRKSNAGTHLPRIKAAIRDGTFDMTIHAIEEMAEDDLELIDIETAKTERDDPRGTRYTVHGSGADGTTRARTVGRFTETARYLIITVFKIKE